MKKLITLIIVLVISSFEIDVNFKNSANAQNWPFVNMEKSGNADNIETKIIHENGITYRIFIHENKNDIEVINETKEKLEIKVLKEKLERDIY